MESKRKNSELREWSKKKKYMERRRVGKIRKWRKMGERVRKGNELRENGEK